MDERRDTITVARSATTEQLVKGSRFIAAVDRCGLAEAAAAFIAEQRDAHPAAHHVCYAYRCGDVLRFNDDGEPGGSAGRPMMEVLERRGLDLVVATVVRYFGGKKLGIGGLVRAYSGSLATALDLAGVAVLPARIEIEVTVPFSVSDAVFRLLEAQRDVDRSAVAYRAGGVVLTLAFPEHHLPDLKAQLRDASRGAARLSSPRQLPLLKGR